MKPEAEKDKVFFHQDSNRAPKKVTPAETKNKALKEFMSMNRRRNCGADIFIKVRGKCREVPGDGAGFTPGAVHVHSLPSFPRPHCIERKLTSNVISRNKF